MVLIGLVLLAFGTMFFGLIWTAWCVVMGLGRGVVGLFRGHPVPNRRLVTNARAGGGRPRVCPRAECRKIETRPARFCSQCGARLTPVEVL